MALWNFIEEYLFPLFGEIPPDSLDKVKSIFWITLGVIIVHFLLYLPYKALLCLMRKCNWKGKWLF